MKKINVFYLFAFLILLLNVSCSSDDDNNNDDSDDTPEPPTETQQLAIDYFTEIALGFEFGNISEVTRKWLDDVVILVEGTPTQVLLNELNIVIDDLNNLIPSSEIRIRTTTDASEANFTVFLGTSQEFADFFPAAANFVANNLGLFFVNFNNNQELINATMYVDTERPTELKQRHLLREELTQALGMAQDSPRFSDSIFQIDFNTGCTVTYSDIDEIIIQLLYDSRVSLNLTENQVRPILEDIIGEFTD